MRNFNKLANLHNMFFKRSDDLSRPPVRSSNPPPAPKPNPKKMPDAWAQYGNMPGGPEGQKTLGGRGWGPEVYNSDTEMGRKARLASTQYVVTPKNFKSEDDAMSKTFPRLLAGTSQQITPPTSYGAQPVPADVGSQVAGGTGGAVAGGTGGVLGGPTNSVSNGPTAGSGGGSPSGSGPVSDYDKYRQGNPGTPTISDYDKYRQGRPGQ